MDLLKRMLLRPLRIMQATYRLSFWKFLWMAGIPVAMAACLAAITINNPNSGLSPTLLTLGFLGGWYIWSAIMYQLMPSESGWVAFGIILLMAGDFMAMGIYTQTLGMSVALGKLMGMMALPMTTDVEFERLGVQ